MCYSFHPAKVLAMTQNVSASQPMDKAVMPSHGTEAPPGLI